MHPSVSVGVTVANANLIISSSVGVAKYRLSLLSVQRLLWQRLPPRASGMGCREIKTIARFQCL